MSIRLLMPCVLVVVSLLGFAGNAFSQDAEMGKEFFELAKQFDKSGDYTKARTYLERAAESNYAPAQTALGVAKLTNKDDLNERLHGLGLITLAGNAGDSKARHILANSLLKNDLGLPIDQEEGVRRFRKLMQEGSAEARYMLGKVYITGTGVEKDEALGLVYIKRAAEKGSPTGPTDHGQRLC